MELQRENLLKVTITLSLSYLQIEQFSLNASDMARVIMNMDGDGLSYHTFEDIGRYTVYPENMFRRMFPTRTFGRYEEEEYKNTRTFGIMTREEGLRITNDLARLTLPHERNMDYNQIVTYENSQVKQDILQDEQRYVAV